MGYTNFNSHLGAVSKNFANCLVKNCISSKDTNTIGLSTNIRTFVL